MTTEYIYHCEGPDCEMQQQSMASAPIAGWLQVIEGLPSLPDVYRDFCSWECSMRFAAQLDPPIVIQMEETSGA
jgi:hypothetical protein